MENINEVTIIFSNSDQVNAFLEWLSNSGEQDYFYYVEDLDEEAQVDKFEYNFKSKVVVAK